MKYKIINKIKLYPNLLYLGCFCILVIFLFEACVNTNFQEPEEIVKNEDFSKIIMNLNISLPKTSGSRSYTDKDGTSEGEKDYDRTKGIENENIVENLILYFLSYEEIEEDDGDQSGDSSNPSEKKYEEKYLFTITSSDVLDFNTEERQSTNIPVSLEDLQRLAGKKCIRIYADGNINHNFSFTYGYFDPVNQVIGSNLLKDFIPLFPINDDESKGFKTPVSSSDWYEVDFSDLSWDDLYDLIHSKNHDDSYRAKYHAVNNLLQTILVNKGPITLERCIARIDFRDYTEKSENRFVYPLVNGEENCSVYVKLVSMTPFNISKESYLLRHTCSGNLTDATYFPGSESTPGTFDVSLFGNENNNPNLGSLNPEEGVDPNAYRWIADRDWPDKRTKSLNLKDLVLNQHFYNLPNKDTNTVSIETGFEGINLEDLVKSYSYNDTYKYYPWRYISENTVPSTSAMIRGLSTGIAFKVVFSDEIGNTYKSISSEFKNYLKSYYKDFNEETDIIQIDDSNRYSIKLGGKTCILTVEENNELSLTYWYFFKHNVFNNHQKGTMDPMQFAIVRNNIYRIAVAGFNGLPRPYDPEEPDEPVDDNCIAVDLKVLSWAKRDIPVIW